MWATRAKQKSLTVYTWFCIDIPSKFVGIFYIMSCEQRHETLIRVQWNTHKIGLGQITPNKAYFPIQLGEIDEMRRNIND